MRTEQPLTLPPTWTHNPAYLQPGDRVLKLFVRRFCIGSVLMNRWRRLVAASLPPLPCPSPARILLEEATAGFIGAPVHCRVGRSGATCWPGSGWTFSSPSHFWNWRSLERRPFTPSPHLPAPSIRKSKRTRLVHFPCWHHWTTPRQWTCSRPLQRCARMTEPYAASVCTRGYFLCPSVLSGCSVLFV